MEVDGNSHKNTYLHRTTTFTLTLSFSVIVVYSLTLASQLPSVKCSERR